MPRLTPTDLSKMYPQPKSYEQRRIEAAHRRQARQPRLVSLRIAIYSTIAVVLAIVAYGYFAKVMTESVASQDSAGRVVADVSFVILFCLIAIGLIYYCYSLIGALVTKVLDAKAWLYAALVIILVACATLLTVFSSNGLNLYINIAAVASFNFIATFVLVFIAIHLQR